jgi:hypothetical protein
MKKCCKCKAIKNETQFSKKKSAKDGLQSRCNECMSKTMLKVYYEDKAAWRKNCKRQKQRKHQWINDFKAEKGCSTCKESDFNCLEFHHLNRSEKEYDISRMVSDNVGDERILKEIERCIVLCANCHRRHHAGTLFILKG